MSTSRKKEQQMVCVCLSLAGQLLWTGPSPRQTCFLFNSWQRRDNSSKTFQVQQMPMGLSCKGAEVWEGEKEWEKEGYSQAGNVSNLVRFQQKRIKRLERTVSSLAGWGQSSWWLISRLQELSSVVKSAMGLHSNIWLIQCSYRAFNCWLCL